MAAWSKVELRRYLGRKGVGMDLEVKLRENLKGNALGNIIKRYRVEVCWYGEMDWEGVWLSESVDV